MVVDSSEFISDVIIFIRNLLRTKVTDPLSRTNGIGFVMTAFPRRKTQYPIITVRQTNIDTQRLGMQSEKQWTTIGIEVQIYAKSSKQSDTLSQQVIDTLRTNEIGASSTRAEEMFGFNITSVVPIVEISGENTIHRKVISCDYKVVL